MASRTLTIEVGNEFIKICEMQKNKNSIMVHHATSVQTPQNTVEDGFIRDIQPVAEAIRGALVEEQIVAKEVTFVLNSSRVATKEVILPLVKRDKIQELVNVNATEYFPINIDDYVLSYTILEEKRTKEEQKSRILVFAAPETMVQSYFDLAAILGMKVKAVDYAGNSTLQLIKIQIDERPTMVVQLGMDTTIVSVMNNNVLQLQRTIPYGESLLLNQVMETRNVKANVALELLSSAQIVKDSLEKDETTSSLRHLISNVNRVIEYYSSRNQDAPLQKIVIIGEGADVLGMDVLFANETSLPAERLTLLKNVESFNRIKVSTSLLKQYMANIGAALDPIHLQPKANNQSKGKKTDENFNIVPYIGVFAVGAIAACVLAAIPLVKYNSLTSEKKDVEDRIEELLPVENVYNEYYAALDQYNDVKTFDTSTVNRTEWTEGLINYLEEIMPSDMKIDSLTVANGEVSFSAVTKMEYEIAGFIEDLEKNPHITNVLTTGYTRNYEPDITTFSMSFSIYTDDYIVDGELVLPEAETEEGN